MPENVSAARFHMQKSDVGRYAIALALVGASCLVRWLLSGILAATPYLSFYPAVAAAAAIGGFGPGIAATILSAVCADLFGWPHQQPGFTDPVWTTRQILFVTGGLGVSLIARALRATQERERRQAHELSRQHEKLQESEQRLRANFDNAALGIIEADPEGRAVEVNERICHILGYRREELLGKSVHALTCPEDQDRSDRLNAELNAGTHPRIDYEKRYVRSDGSPVWVHVTVSSVQDAAGRHLRSIGTVEDISQRKQAEEALRRSEERYRSFVEATTQVVWTTNHLGEVVMDIPAWQAFTGQTADEARGFGWMNAIRPEDRDRVAAAWRDASNNRGVYEVEYLLRIHDGSWRHVLARGVPVLNADGTVREYVGACIDITARKRAEQALQESESFYRQTLESIPGMVFTTRPDGYCDYQSQQWEDYTGIPMSEHLGDGWNRLLHPDDRPRAFAAWRDAVEGRAPYDLEYRVRRHDGQYEWFRVIGRPIRDTEGDIVRWFGVAVNIEQLKRSEEAMAASMARVEQAKMVAEEANHIKDRFLAVMSHELRTPLTPVLAAVSMLQKNPGPYKRMLETIRRNIELEARLIDDLLDLTSIARETIGLNKRPVELRSVIERAVEVCRPDIEGRKVNFGVTCDREAYPVEADMARLQQVFWNLLKNAVKFTPHGGCIGVRCRNENNSAVVEVTDSGIGIEPDALGRVFNPCSSGPPVEQALRRGRFGFVDQQDNHRTARRHDRGDERGQRQGRNVPGTSASCDRSYQPPCNNSGAAPLAR